jgi:hypothetical protein
LDSFGAVEEEEEEEEEEEVSPEDEDEDEDEEGMEALEAVVNDGDGGAPPSVLVVLTWVFRPLEPPRDPRGLPPRRPPFLSLLSLLLLLLPPLPPPPPTSSISPVAGLYSNRFSAIPAG